MSFLGICFVWWRGRERWRKGEQRGVKKGGGKEEWREGWKERERLGKGIYGLDRVFALGERKKLIKKINVMKCLDP